MKITAKQYAISLLEALEGKDEKAAKKVIGRFAEVLVANNQVSDLKKITMHFNRLWNKEYKIIEAEIIAARPLSSKIQEELEKYIRQKSQADQVELTVAEDKRLLGGVIIKYNDKIIDASVKTKLLKLKDKLSN